MNEEDKISARIRELEARQYNPMNPPADYDDNPGAYCTDAELIELNALRNRRSEP